jgi:hypothetical protein
MVSVAAAIFSDVQHFWVSAIVGNLFVVSTAIGAWSGALWKNREHETQAPTTWRHWIGIFFAAIVVSGIFVGIDVAVVHPGIGLVFTFGALAMSFVALPSALRAWIMEKLSQRHGEVDK